MKDDRSTRWQAAPEGRRQPQAIDWYYQYTPREFLHARYRAYRASHPRIDPADIEAYAPRAMLRPRAAAPPRRPDTPAPASGTHRTATDKREHDTVRLPKLSLSLTVLS